MRVLDVEHLQRARRALVACFLVERLGMGVEPGVQPLDVRRAAGGVSDRVQQQLELRHSEQAQQLVEELDHLGVDGGIGRADRLDRELPVLAVAPAAGGAVAVHRCDREGLHRLRLLVQPVLDVGTCDRRGPSGRSVSERSLRSLNVYISLCTTRRPRRLCARRAQCPRTPGSGCARSRSGGSGPRSSARGATTWRRRAGRRASRAAPGTLAHGRAARRAGR